MQNINEVQLKSLLQAAQQAAAEGRLSDAAKSWEQILALAPDHPQTLFRLGQYVLQQNDPRRARELLERAAAAAPRDALPALHLAVANRALGDADGEADAIDRALAIDPFCYPALFLKGALLERLGRKRQAARVYKDALSVVPPDEQLSPDLRDQVSRARAAVQDNAKALKDFLERDLAQVRARHQAENLNRFDICEDVAVGLKKVYVQQPTVFHFPGLPAVQFYDNAEFPWIPALESQTEAIREEFLRAYREQQNEFAPYVEIGAGIPVNQWTELNFSSRWSALHFWRHGEPFRRVHELCPQTARAIDAVPKIEIGGFTPTALYSVLSPHTRIPRHTSSSNIRLIVHLPLIVPDGCGFRVGNETRHWEVGKAWVFDDSIDHEAWNDSDEFRAILMIDVWNPFLSPAERELCATLHGGIRSYYGPETAYSAE